MGGKMKNKLLAGLLVLAMFMIPIQVNSFSEDYSIMPLMQEQLQKIEQKSYELYNILVVPDTLYQANGVVIELSTDQKKDLFDVGKARYLELKSMFDSLQVLVQAFEKDSIF
jgi:hypothetical protein